MRNEDSFTHFLKTGELGPLSFSLDLEEVYQVLGPPEKTYRPYSYMGEEKDNQINLYYKNLAIVFINGTFEQFICYFDKREKGLPDVLDAKWYSEVQRADYLFFLNYLKNHNIFCQKIIQSEPDAKMLFIKHSEQQHITIPFDQWKNDRVKSIICSSAGPGNWQLQDC